MRTRALAAPPAYPILSTSENSLGRYYLVGSDPLHLVRVQGDNYLCLSPICIRSGDSMRCDHVAAVQAHQSTEEPSVIADLYGPPLATSQPRI